MVLQGGKNVTSYQGEIIQACYGRKSQADEEVNFINALHLLYAIASKVFVHKNKWYFLHYFNIAIED